MTTFINTRFVFVLLFLRLSWLLAKSYLQASLDFFIDVGASVFQANSIFFIFNLIIIVYFFIAIVLLIEYLFHELLLVSRRRLHLCLFLLLFQLMRRRRVCLSLCIFFASIIENATK